jgi:hypothetical protein
MTLQTTHFGVAPFEWVFARRFQLAHLVRQVAFQAIFARLRCLMFRDIGRKRRHAPARRKEIQPGHDNDDNPHKKHIARFYLHEKITRKIKLASQVWCRITERSSNLTEAGSEVNQGKKDKSHEVHEEREGGKGR